MPDNNKNETEWTAWQVWLHPRRACYAIDNAYIMENELSRRLEEALKDAETHRSESQRMAGEIDTLSSKLKEHESALAQRDSELEEARAELKRTRECLAEAEAELAERKDVETQIREFDEKLKGMENMKRGYEKRIRDLETRLRDAMVEKHTREEDCELLAPGETSVRTEAPTSSDEWLMELPEDL